MKTIRVNGVNITINGDADVNVDRYGNVTVNVRPNYVPVQWELKPIIPNYFPKIGKKHWLER